MKMGVFEYANQDMSSFQRILATQYFDHRAQKLVFKNWTIFAIIVRALTIYCMHGMS